MRRPPAFLPSAVCLALASGCGSAVVWRSRSPDGRHMAEVRRDGDVLSVLRDGERVGPPTFDVAAVGWSERDGMLAYASELDGRSWTVIHGGRPGPRFDAIGELRLDRFGRSVAYAARQGSRWRVVRAGADAAGPPDLGPEVDELSTDSLVFSPNGRRLAYAARVAGRACAVVDGSPGPAFDGIGALRFSPDSRRLGYLARADERAFVVVDDRISPAYEAIASLTVGLHDHVAFLGRTSDGWRAVIDDVEGPSLRAAWPVKFASQGSRAVYVGREDAGERVHDTAGDGPRFDEIAASSLVPSSDGAHVAYFARDGEGWHVVLDHVTGPAYDALRTLRLTNGPHWAAIAVRGRREHLLHDGAESEGFRHVYALAPSPDGARVAAVVRRKKDVALWLDGTATRFGGIVPASLAWRVDGAHVGCLVVDGSAPELVVDGEARQPLGPADGWIRELVGAVDAGPEADVALRTWVEVALGARTTGPPRSGRPGAQSDGP